MRGVDKETDLVRFRICFDDLVNAHLKAVFLAASLKICLLHWLKSNFHCQEEKQNHIQEYKQICDFFLTVAQFVI